MSLTEYRAVAESQEWSRQQLGHLADVATGSTPPTADRSNYGDEYLFVSPADLGGNKYISRTSKMLSRLGFSKSRKFPKGSVLFVCIGSTIGKCAIASRELTSNQQINAVLPSPNVSMEYIYYALSVQADAIACSAGEQAVPIVNKASFAATIIPFPPTLAEQEAIAEALSDADALIEGLESLIAKKRAIKQGAMQELLTGKRRLPGFEGEWKHKPLGEIVSRLANGAVYRPARGQGLSITRIETIASGMVNYGRVGIAESAPELNNYRLLKGDILFSHINSLDHIGKVALFSDDRPLYHGMNLLLLRVNAQACSAFLYFTLASERFRQIARTMAKQAVSQASINTRELRGFQILLPPRVEQTAIAAILTDMDDEIAALEGKLTKARQVKQGMMQELLTGRIRLV